jgi:SAM-dependent methyltransferase
MRPDGGRFRQAQARFFESADAAHFFWQTQGPYFSRTERELLAGFPEAAGLRVLELGCGEGGNLVNLFGTSLAPPRLVVGLDLFPRKLAFARIQYPTGRFACGDAGRLPFADAAFDLVLCRDLLHHLEDPEPALRELLRVLGPGGRIWIVEPNGRNPMIALLALVRPHERGQLGTTPRGMRTLAERHFADVTVETRQPLPSTGPCSTTSSACRASVRCGPSGPSWTDGSAWAGCCCRAGGGRTSSYARHAAPRGGAGELGAAGRSAGTGRKATARQVAHAVDVVRGRGWLARTSGPGAASRLDRQLSAWRSTG